MSHRIALFVFVASSALWSTTEALGQSMATCYVDMDCPTGESCLGAGADNYGACGYPTDPPADTWSCADLDRAADLRLCDAYCDALDCQGEANANEVACDTLAGLIAGRVSQDFALLACAE